MMGFAVMVCSALAAPQAEPEPQQLRVVVVDREAHVPRPAVPVYLLPTKIWQTPPDPGGAWVTNVDLPTRRLLAATCARTDPEGRVEFTLPPDDDRALFLFAGAPFVGTATPGPSSPVELPVDQHEPFTVQAVDDAGTPLSRFAVALHAAGKDVAVALTDENGIAVLGIPPGFEARLCVAPAGWTGPRDAFPTVAAMLDHEVQTLRVPPFGKLRIRAVSAGEPVLVKTGVASILRRNRAGFIQGERWTSTAGGERMASGFEFGPVALGQRLLCSASLGGRRLYDTVDGPKAAGEVVVVDVDTDPPRARVTFTLTGGEAFALGEPPITVRAITDRATATVTARPGPDGHPLADFGDGLDVGDTLDRVEIDVPRHARNAAPGTEAVPAAVRSASVPVGRAFAGPPLDLGAVELDLFPPVVRGRVVDEAGQPVQRAAVTIEPDPSSNPPARWLTTCYTDRDGRFECLGPVPRDGDGEPVGLVVRVRLGERTTAPPQPLPIGEEVELTLPAATRVAAEGTLTAVLADLPSGLEQQLRAELHDEGAAVHEGSISPEGIVTFTGLPAGRYSLHLKIAPSTSDVLVLPALDVPAHGACRDDRLPRLLVADRISVADFRVVDRDGVPVADARATVYGEGRAFCRTSDASGRMRLAYDRNVVDTLEVTAARMRPQRLTDPRGDVLVVMEPAATLTARVAGVPDDLARTRIRLALMPDTRIGSALAERTPLGDDDTATFALPATGRYRLSLEVVLEESATQSRSTRIVDGPPFEIGADPPASLELTLDPAAIAKLRDAVSKT